MNNDKSPKSTDKINSDSLDKETLDDSAPKNKREPLSTGSKWTFELLETYDREIARIAKGYRLDT